MSDFDRYSRVNKFEKRRKNTKLMSLLIVAGSFLIILLIGLWIFGPDDEPEQPKNIASSNDSASEDDEETAAENESGEDDSQTEETSSISDEDDSSETDASDDGINNDMQDPGEKMQVDFTDDNVIEAYTKEWQPIGTEQEGPHTTQFVVDSQDWIEMESAIRYATGLSEDDMFTWFIGNGGDQKAIGTVTNKAKTEIYRVYISWIDNQGWQPTKVEVLKENDKD